MGLIDFVNSKKFHAKIVDKKITDIPTMQIIAEASTVVGLKVISTGPLRVKNKNLFLRLEKNRGKRRAKQIHLQ